MSFSEFPYRATIKREVITESYPNPDVVVTNTIFTGYVDLSMGNKGDGIPFKCDYKIMFVTPKKALDIRVDDIVEVNYGGRTIIAKVINYSFSQLGKTTVYVTDNAISNG